MTLVLLPTLSNDAYCIYLFVFYKVMLQQTMEPTINIGDLMRVIRQATTVARKYRVLSQMTLVLPSLSNDTYCI